ncbi:MAG: protein-L-isoaspartate(D-aspartate) O-methyltransferase [Burkholderiales bacterium]
MKPPTTQRSQGIGMTSMRTRTRMVERLREQGIKDEAVLEAVAQTPRHIFVEEALASRAYEDNALPIGHGQTISSPYIVARMTELLLQGSLGAHLGKVLEIGTGCGYQTAVLAKFSDEIYSVERIGPLLAKARGHLRELKCNNAKLFHADGNIGLATAAPFDGILMAAAATRVPPGLLQQMAIGGRMVLPLGTAEQFLTVIDRTENGFLETRFEPVRFVPLRGDTI